ncbi:hypothetical protein D0T60_14975 [Bacteroides sp. 224]|nr:hypothetical protein [Bacteroides sp. 224]
MLRKEIHIIHAGLVNLQLTGFNVMCNYMIFNIELIPTKLTCNGTIACKESTQSVNCKAVTKVQGEKAYMRMKPDWLNDSSAVYDVATTESSYIRCIGVPAQCSFVSQAQNGLQRDRNKRINERKSHPTICRANSYCKTKRRLVVKSFHKGILSGWIGGRVTALSSIWISANGAPIVVRARESRVHGEGEQVNRQVLKVKYVRDI